MSTDRRPLPNAAEPCEPQALWTEAAWQLPAILFTGWWNTVAACMPATPHPHRHAPAPDDHQLAVPDPIEDEGEHALFA